MNTFSPPHLGGQLEAVILAGRAPWRAKSELPHRVDRGERPTETDGQRLVEEGKRRPP
jgi:hypothetical protein